MLSWGSNLGLSPLEQYSFSSWTDREIPLQVQSLLEIACCLGQPLGPERDNLEKDMLTFITWITSKTISKSIPACIRGLP